MLGLVLSGNEGATKNLFCREDIVRPELLCFLPLLRMTK